MIPQFYLFTPLIDDPLAFRPRLEAVLDTGAIDVVRARFAAKSELEVKKLATSLVHTVQEKGAALLVDCPEDPRMIARLGLDGTHIREPGPRLADAIGALKPERIIGIGGLKARHDAMEAGELDIDYVMFGEPRADGSLPALTQTIERAEWWAEIFNVPCVAYAPDLDAVTALAGTGTEFIALGDWVFDSPDPAGTVAEARRRAKARLLSQSEPG
jgi:thiamine-phosphate pyrophosphorylase